MTHKADFEACADETFRASRVLCTSAFMWQDDLVIDVHFIADVFAFTLLLLTAGT